MPLPVPPRSIPVHAIPECCARVFPIARGVPPRPTTHIQSPATARCIFSPALATVGGWIQCSPRYPKSPTAPASIGVLRVLSAIHIPQIPNSFSHPLLVTHTVAESLPASLWQIPESE